MAATATVAPALSTPDTRIAEAPAPVAALVRPHRTNEHLGRIYEVERTVSEIQAGKWKRIALQFPDNLLPDAPRVYRLLSERLRRRSMGAVPLPASSHRASLPAAPPAAAEEPESLYVLADTSYGACCADELAAEHVAADAIVHYGRACLSPTARLPVVHVFTAEELDVGSVAAAFRAIYPDRAAPVILMADAPFQCHVAPLHALLRSVGYTAVFPTAIVYDPAAPLPNRTSPAADGAAPDQAPLARWALFHVSSPPPALLLTLASRVASIHVYPTDTNPAQPSGPEESTAPVQPEALLASSALALRRRYGLLTRVSRAAIIGILVNTLSVHSYQDALRGTQARIAAAGKKAYVFAMGRPNPAKVANFAEVDGWVVLGCWESSLIENTDFSKPLVTSFELELALQDDSQRVWTGEWRGDFSSMAKHEHPRSSTDAGQAGREDREADKVEGVDGQESESESEPPEYDLHTGRYVLPSRPMSKKPATKTTNGSSGQNALARRAKGHLAIIGGEVSPGAQFLKDKRTWRGLGSDFEIAYEENGTAGSQIKEGRRGIARGYAGEQQNGQASPT